MIKRMAALLLIGGLAIAGCGSDSESSAKTAGNGTDRAFVAAMIPHHESAVDMAEIAKTRAQSAFVTDLAADITKTQTEEISLMREVDAKLEEAGIQPGKLSVSEHMMGMDQDIGMLESANPFDAAFIDMMIPHHEGALEMAREELDKGANPELKELARNIVDAQQREIDEMVAHSKGKTHSGHDG